MKKRSYDIALYTQVERRSHWHMSLREILSTQDALYISSNHIVPYISSTHISRYIQVERRVVSQLALAHERNLIQSGCSLHLTVDNPQSELTKSQPSSAPSGGGKDKPVVPMIKLQIKSKGRKYVDVDLDKVNFHL